MRLIIHSWDKNPKQEEKETELPSGEFIVIPPELLSRILIGDHAGARSLNDLINNPPKTS